MYFHERCEMGSCSKADLREIVHLGGSFSNQAPRINITKYTYPDRPLIALQKNHEAQPLLLLCHIRSRSSRPSRLRLYAWTFSGCSGRARPALDLKGYRPDLLGRIAT